MHATSYRATQASWLVYNPLFGDVQLHADVVEMVRRTLPQSSASS